MQETQLTCTECIEFNKMCIYGIQGKKKARWHCRVPHYVSYRQISYPSWPEHLHLTIRTITEEHHFRCEKCGQEWILQENPKIEKRNTLGIWTYLLASHNDDSYYQHADFRLKVMYLAGLLPTRDQLNFDGIITMVVPENHTRIKVLK